MECMLHTASHQLEVSLTYHWKMSTEHVMKQIRPREGARAPWAEVFQTPGFHIRLSLRFSEYFAKSPGMKISEVKGNRECHTA